MQSRCRGNVNRLLYGQNRSVRHGSINTKYKPKPERVKQKNVNFIPLRGFPGKLRLIFAGRRKNDRLDAAKLAMLLRMDVVSAVHVPSVDVRQWRRMIEARRELIAKRTRTKNQIRSLLRNNGLRSQHRLWSGWRSLAG